MTCAASLAEIQNDSQFRISVWQAEENELAERVVAGKRSELAWRLLSIGSAKVRESIYDLCQVIDEVSEHLWQVKVDGKSMDELYQSSGDFEEIKDLFLAGRLESWRSELTRAVEKMAERVYP